MSQGTHDLSSCIRRVVTYTREPTQVVWPQEAEITDFGSVDDPINLSHAAVRKPSPTGGGGGTGVSLSLGKLGRRLEGLLSGLPTWRFLPWGQWGGDTQNSLPATLNAHSSSTIEGLQSIESLIFP